MTSQIRTLVMLRSRFISLPGAFNACLIPVERNEKTKKKGLKATFSSKFDEVWLLFFIIKYHDNDQLTPLEVCLSELNSPFPKSINFWENQ